MDTGMRRELAIQIGIYCLCVALASILWRRPVTLSLCYVLTSILVLYRWHTRSDLIFYSVAFVLGPIGEMVTVHSGAWEYSRPLYFIPVWLPFLWGIAALFIKKLSETFVAME
jgi:hypothetical protein